MIRFYGVDKVFAGNTPALRELEFSVEPGEMVYLTGPTGAGKSTLLRLIHRQELPTRGQILVDGRNVPRMRGKQIAYYRRNIGLIFQDFKLLNERSVFDNVAIVPRVAGAGESDIKRLVWQVLKLVGLEGRDDAIVSHLSGGEQQRVCIARATVLSPRIVLADEPTGSLDAESAARIHTLLEEINARGATVLIATHDLDQVRRSGRRVLALKDGRLAADTPAFHASGSSSE